MKCKVLSIVILTSVLCLPKPVLAQEDANKITIDTIHPVTGYLSKEHDGFDFDISGQNLASSARDNIIEVIGQGPLAVGTDDECRAYDKNHHYDKVCLSYESGMEGRKLLVRGFHPARYKGPVDMKIRVGSNVSNSVRVTFAGISEQGLRLTAILVFILLVIIVLSLVWKGIGSYKIAGEPYSPLASFFLDKETNSFSLSKFQLLAWTAVAVFSYVYLFLCRIFIQWDFSFPPIPDNLPMLLGISAGTTVAAIGATVTRGSKGAGPVKPSFADFVSSGGLVESERFQFFVWTIVGCLGFLALVLKDDPSTLRELPKVPDGFLYLMGISSAGYLGGKLVRKPGPVVKALLVTNATEAVPFKMKIQLEGENLSRNPGIKLDGDTLRKDEFTILAAEPLNQDPFCSKILVQLNDASDYLEGEHTLTIVNDDRQEANSRFPLDPMSIESVADVPQGVAAVAVDVKGKNFADDTTGQWQAPGAEPVPIDKRNITKTSDAALRVSLVPGAQPGKGKLTLISEIHLRASKEVNVT